MNELLQIPLQVEVWLYVSVYLNSNNKNKNDCFRDLFKTIFFFFEIRDIRHTRSIYIVYNGQEKYVTYRIINLPRLEYNT